MTSSLTKKVYSYVWPKDSMRRAEIIFQAAAPNGFVFVECKFNGVHTIYNRDDWVFLKDLAIEVEELVKENQ